MRFSLEFITRSSDRPDVSVFTPDTKLVEFGAFWYVVFGMSFGTQNHTAIVVSRRVHVRVTKTAVFDTGHTVACAPHLGDGGLPTTLEFTQTGLPVLGVLQIRA